MPRWKEAAAGLSEYSRRRVQSLLVDSTVWHKKSALVIGLLLQLGQLSQTCDSQTCESKWTPLMTSIYLLTGFTLKGIEHHPMTENTKMPISKQP